MNNAADDGRTEQLISFARKLLIIRHWLKRFREKFTRTTWHVHRCITRLLDAVYS